MDIPDESSASGTGVTVAKHQARGPGLAQAEKTTTAKVSSAARFVGA